MHVGHGVGFIKLDQTPACFFSLVFDHMFYFNVLFVHVLAIITYICLSWWPIVSNQKAGEGLGLPSKARQRQDQRAKAKGEEVFLAKLGKGKRKDKGKGIFKEECQHHHQQQQPAATQPRWRRRRSQWSSLAMCHGHKSWAKVPVGLQEPCLRTSKTQLPIFCPACYLLAFIWISGFQGCG